MSSIYDFTVKDRKGNDVSLKDYEGKVLLIVNTATGCGFTPHYDPLEAMYEELKDKGFLTIAGRVNKQYFMEKTCYSTAENRERK